MKITSFGSSGSSGNRSNSSNRSSRSSSSSSVMAAKAVRAATEDFDMCKGASTLTKISIRVVQTRCYADIGALHVQTRARGLQRPSE